MRLFVELFVSDLALARAFYRDAVGLKIARDEDDFVALVSDGAQINLAPLNKLSAGHYLATREGNLAARVELCVEVDDVDEAYRRAVAAGAIVVDPIMWRTWGRTDFRILDPDGAYLRITTKPAHSYPSP